MREKPKKLDLANEEAQNHERNQVNPAGIGWKLRS